MLPLDRRQFIKTTSAAGLSLAAFSFSQQNTNFPDIAVTRHAGPAMLVRHAIDALGGISRFVKKGSTVLVKPNIGWDRAPELAANTNPEIVATVVKMCLEQGAKRVRVLDRTCNQAQRCYRNSGIEKAASDAGAQVRFVVESRFRKINIPNGLLIKSWPVYKDALDFDVLINIPVAKVHTASRFSLGMKNLMGLLGGDRGELHVDFDTKIVDINTCIRPDLTIIDAFRVLVRNGPTGGNPADTELLETVIASADRVAADAYAVTLFGELPEGMVIL